MKLHRMVLENSVNSRDIGKIVSIEASLDYCLFFSEKGVVFGEGNNYGNILGLNVVNASTNLTTRQK